MPGSGASVPGRLPWEHCLDHQDEAGIQGSGHLAGWSVEYRSISPQKYTGQNDGSPGSTDFRLMCFDIQCRQELVQILSGCTWCMSAPLSTRCGYLDVNQLPVTVREQFIHPLNSADDQIDCPLPHRPGLLWPSTLPGWVGSPGTGMRATWATWDAGYGQLACGPSCFTPCSSQGSSCLGSCRPSRKVLCDPPWAMAPSLAWVGTYAAYDLTNLATMKDFAGVVG